MWIFDCYVRLPECNSFLEQLGKVNRWLLKRQLESVAIFLIDSRLDLLRGYPKQIPKHRARSPPINYMLIMLGSPPSFGFTKITIVNICWVNSPRMRVYSSLAYYSRRSGNQPTHFQVAEGEVTVKHYGLINLPPPNVLPGRKDGLFNNLPAL